MEHNVIPKEEVHVAYRWKFDDETARLAEVVVEADVGKWAYQIDTKEIYELTSHDPVTWVVVANYTDVSGKENTGVAASLVSAHEADAEAHPQFNDAINQVLQGSMVTGLIQNNNGAYLQALNNTTLRILEVAGAFFEGEIGEIGDSIKTLSQQDVALSTIGLVDDGQYIRYVGIDKDGVVSFSNTPVLTDKTRIQLGLVYVRKNGATVEFIDGTTGPLNVLTIPSLASSNYAARLVHEMVVRLPIAPNNNLTFSQSEGMLIGENINWGNPSNANLKIIAASNPMQFLLIHAGLGQLPSVPSPSTTFDPTQYWNGTALVTLGSASNASVQRILVTLRGTVIVQYGEQEYGNLDDAARALPFAPFTDGFPMGYTVEIARIAIRRNATDLSDTNQARMLLTSGTGTTGSTGGVDSVFGRTGTITAQANDYTFAQIASTPTTLAGYGITDATPSSHVGSGGTQHASATTSVSGFMSPADKTKLDGISAGAQVNQNAFSSIGFPSNSVTFSAGSPTDTFNIVPGTSISFALDAPTNGLIINSTAPVYSIGDGLTSSSNVVAVNNTVLRTNTEQTVSAKKTFTAAPFFNSGRGYVHSANYHRLENVCVYTTNTQYPVGMMVLRLGIGGFATFYNIRLRIIRNFQPPCIVEVGGFFDGNEWVIDPIWANVQGSTLVTGVRFGKDAAGVPFVAVYGTGRLEYAWSYFPKFIAESVDVGWIGANQEANRLTSNFTTSLVTSDEGLTFDRILEGGAVKKNWSQYNHGPGSGLDADLLDGQQGSYYLNTGNVQATPYNATAGKLLTPGSFGLGGAALNWGSANYNEIPLVTGVFQGPNGVATNGPPDNGAYQPMLRMFRSANGNRAFDISAGHAGNTTGPRLSIRFVDGTTYGPWQRVSVAGVADNNGNALFGTTTDTGEKLQAVGGFRADSIKEGSEPLVEKYADGLRHFVLPPVAGDYIDQSVDAVTLTTATQTVDRLRMVPFIPSRTITINQLGVAISTAVAEGFIVVGIYSSNADNTPNALLAQTAELPTDTATGVYSTVSQTLVAGQLYWLAWNTNASGLVLRACVAGSGRAVGTFSSGTIVTKLTMLEQTSTYNNTLPATWGTYSSSQRIGGHPASIRMRIA